MRNCHQNRRGHPRCVTPAVSVNRCRVIGSRLIALCARRFAGLAKDPTATLKAGAFYTLANTAYTFTG